MPLAGLSSLPSWWPSRGDVATTRGSRRDPDPSLSRPPARTRMFISWEGSSAPIVVSSRASTAPSKTKPAAQDSPPWCVAAADRTPDYSALTNTPEISSFLSSPGETHSPRQHSQMWPAYTGAASPPSRVRFSDIGPSSPRPDSYLRHSHRTSDETGMELSALGITRNIPELGDNTRFELAGGDEHRERQYVPSSPPARPS